MEAFIARQPIFNAHSKVIGYELLYRDNIASTFADFVDGNKATCRLLSDAITLFGLPNLTNSQPAYVNFTRELIMSDFVCLAPPNEVIVEILEDTVVDDDFIARCKELKRLGYTLALDDYTGDARFDALLPLADILKVDFRLTDAGQQRQIAQTARASRLRLLAEKVETAEDFSRACGMGYTMFQGYYFQRPVTFQKRLPSLAASSYGRVLKELHQEEINFDRCAEIIHSDVTLLYRLMQRARTVRYYRGNTVTAIKQALVIMGSKEVARWTLLILARENNIGQSDELVRAAYFRAVFISQLMRETIWEEHCEDGFLLGMFSMLGGILGMSTEQMVKEIELPDMVTEALIGTKENYLTRFLQFVIVYEMGNPAMILPDIGLCDENCYIPDIYMQSIAETDAAFSLVSGVIK